MKTVIQGRHAVGSLVDVNISLVKDSVGKVYPKSPANDYVIRFADGLMIAMTIMFYSKMDISKDNSEIKIIYFKTFELMCLPLGRQGSLQIPMLLVNHH